MASITVMFKRLGSKRVGGIAACLVAMAVVYFGLGIGGESPKKAANASAPSTDQRAPMKPVQAMNLALGNMVFLAQELGFSIKTAEDAPFDGSKIALRIESHLQRLREIYRQESGKNAALVGSVMLQFKISPSGEVSQVSELSSRINDAEFKAAILAEIAKWSFGDLVPEPVRVTCPLLFVREGMDITTLVQWEKSFASGGEKATPIGSVESATPIVAAKTEPTKTPPKATPKITQSTADEAEIKYSTSLRKQPDFSSASLTTIAAGTRVTVLSKAGDWLEVRLGAAEPSGFVRKEFVKPVQVASE